MDALIYIFLQGEVRNLLIQIISCCAHKPGDEKTNGGVVNGKKVYRGKRQLENDEILMMT